MELTSQTLKDAQFRQAWKGYDTAEVDDFLDELAVGVDVIAGRLKDALERLAEAESRAVRAESRPVVKPQADESVRRTLVLAQRAADLVVTEAKSVADRIVADAHAQAAAIVAAGNSTAGTVERDAATKAAAVISEAEATAQRMTAQRAAELQQELSGLIEDQARRRLEIEQLTSQADAAYAHLRGQLQAQLEQLDALRIESAAPSPVAQTVVIAEAPVAQVPVEAEPVEAEPVGAEPVEAEHLDEAPLEPVGVEPVLAEATLDDAAATDDDHQVITLGGSLVDDRHDDARHAGHADIAPPDSLAGPGSPTELDPASMFLDLADAIGGRGRDVTATSDQPDGPAADGSGVVADRRLSAMAMALLHDRSASDSADEGRSTAAGAD